MLLFQLFSLESSKNENKKERKIDSSILNIKAVKNPDTLNPGTKFPASMIIIAFMTNRNNPSEKIVAGKVKRIIKGLTNMFNKEMTIATTKAVI